MAQLQQQLESLVLHYLADNPSVAQIEDSLVFLQQQLPRSTMKEHEVFVSVLTSLVGFSYLNTKPIEHPTLSLTSEGEEYASKGTPEYQVYQLLPAAPDVLKSTELEAKLGKQLASLGLAQCMSKRWIEFQDKKEGTLKRKVDNIVDECGLALQSIKAGHYNDIDKAVIDLLKKRKLIAQSSYKTYLISRGSKFARERKVLATDLTVDMLKGDKWKESDFKEYNFNATAQLPSGCLHPLMKVRSQFRQIFLEMGFEEMQTNNYVESSFWNFDTLFQPQQHPARDAHDTFFIKEPSTTLSLPTDYVHRTQHIHEQGGYGSIGYRYHWKINEAEKNILRTHTTAVSSRMLYALSKQCPFQPKRYFSIDRVFRNETLDATHLAEFHQIEGLIADRNLTLGDLIGTISTFFKRIGISDVKFKPAYNPYTEPSMEIFGYSQQLNKWIEVGNSGMFRPEMLRPMGLPEDVRVIAWGLGLERPTMLVYGIKHIRDLFGPKVKLEIIQNNPICRFDKNQVVNSGQEEKEKEKQ